MQQCIGEVEDKRLMERGYGDFEGITKAELREIKK